MGKTPKSEKKEKKTVEAEEEGGAGEVPYDTKVKRVSVIAKPLADEKLCKKVLKLCKKASKRKAIRQAGGPVGNGGVDADHDGAASVNACALAPSPAGGE